MRRLGTRCGIAAVPILVAMWLVPPAWGCNEPRMSIYAPPEVRAGDTVPFELSDTLVGAEYAVKVNGETIQTGTDTTEAQGYRGSFEVPDLGAETQEVSFDGYVSHEEDGASSIPTSAQARYNPPAATSPPPPAASDQPAPRQNPAPVGSTPSIPAGPGNSGGVPVAPLPTRPGGSRPAGPAAGDASPEQTQGPTARSRARQAVAPSPTAAEAASRARAPALAEESSEAARRSRGDNGVSAQEPLRRAVPVHAWGSERVDVAGGVTPSVLVALAVLLLVGLAGGGFSRVRSRKPTPWVPPEIRADSRARERLIEAELQELIAEHRVNDELGEPRIAAETTDERELVGSPGA